MPEDLTTQWLGRIEYSRGLALQEELVEALHQGKSGEHLLLLEHDPVYTMGRTPDQTSLRGGAHLPHPVIQINRGGQATYHGPGQLVGYPILNLRNHGQDLHRYLRALEELLIETCAHFGVRATRREGLTGVWVEERKIASIGVGVRHWISMHGFALNVCGDLSPFDQITPCGIPGVRMTNLEKETGREVSVRETAAVVNRLFPARPPFASTCGPDPKNLKEPLSLSCLSPAPLSITPGTQ